MSVVVGSAERVFESPVWVRGRRRRHWSRRSRARMERAAARALTEACEFGDPRLVQEARRALRDVRRRVR